jgi:hypothetical protein
MNRYLIDTTRKTAPKQLSKKQQETIMRRQELALMYRAKDKIEDYQNDVFSIIENEGLNNEESKVKLETALKVLEYIIPKKKSTETTIITRKLEDIIQDHIQEAEVIEIKPDEPSKE